MAGSIRIQNLMQLFEAYWMRGKKTLDEFQTRFTENPRQALEWADDVYLAASEMESVMVVQRRLTAFLEGDDLTTDNIMASLDREFRIKMDKSRMSGNTSTSHRAMDLAESQIGNGWFNEDYTPLNCLCRSNVLVALREVVAEREAARPAQ